MFRFFLFFCFSLSFVVNVYAFDPLEKIKNIKEGAMELGTSIFKKEKKLPRNIAVLPAKGEGEEDDKREIRTTFYNHISYKNYDILKISDVDSKLYIYEKEKGKKWDELTSKELGEILNVEGLIYLDILGIEKIYAALYASLTLKLRVKLVSTETGEIIWEKEDSVTERSGGLPTSPWSAISTAVSSALVLRESVKIALTDKLCRSLAKEIPEPKGVRVKRLPQIYSVLTNALDSPFKAQDEILVSLSAQEGLTAYFNIGNERKAIELKEIKQGEYLGKYVVKEGDFFKNQIITAYLYNPKENTESSYIVPHSVTVDTIPPSPVADIKINSLSDGLLISWKSPDDEDLKDFVVTRSDLDNPNFVEIGSTPVNEFLDKNIQFGKKYFYRVYARDKANNLSKHEEKAFTAVKRGPTILPKEIRENTTLYSAGSPYIVEDEVFLLKDVKLIIEDGVVLEFKNKGKLISMGKIYAKGNKDSRIAFKGNDYVIEVKDAGEDAFLLEYGILEKGKEIIVSNSNINFSNVEIIDFDTFIKADRKANINLSYVTAMTNVCGLDINSSNVNVKNTTIKSKNISLSLKGNVKIASERLVVSGEQNIVLAEGNILIDELETLEKNEFDFLKKIKGIPEIKMVFPFAKNIHDLRGQTVNELKRELSEYLIKSKYLDAYDSIKKIELISEEEFNKLVDVALYLSYQLKKVEEVNAYLNSKNLKGSDYFKKSLISNEKEQKYVVTFVDVKLSLIKEKDDIDKVSSTRAKWRAVKTYIDAILGDLSRDKISIVNEKIIPKFSNYVPLVIPINFYVSEIMFDGFYMAFLDKQMLLNDLKEAGLIGEKEKDFKIALIDCTGMGITKRLLLKHLILFNYQIEDFGIAHCDPNNYYDTAVDKQVDILIMIQEKVKVSQSLVGGNLKTFSASLDISAFDVYLRKPLLSLSKGATIYHMNEDDGKEMALKNSYNNILESFERELRLIEKNLSNDENRKKIKKLSYAEKYLPPLEIKVLSAEKIFANNYKIYEKSPFLKISITNNTSRDLEKLKIAVMMKDFMDFPTEKSIEKLSPLETIDVDIEGIFNNKLLELTENSTIQIDIKAKYFKGGDPKEINITHPISVMEKHALTWKDRRRIAIFVTSRDPVIVDLSRNIVRNLKKKFINDNISSGIAIFEAMKALGIIYQRDPNNPYNVVSEKEDQIDYVQFPRETLKRKTGDCDDLVSLFSALAESLGIDTVAIDYPGHILIMFNTGISKDDLLKSGIDEKKVVIYEGYVWIPVELTQLTGSFINAWEKGIRNVIENQSNNLNFINIKKAWEIYKPPTLLDIKMSIDLPSNFENIMNNIFSELKKLRNEEIAKGVKSSSLEPEKAIYFLYKNNSIDDALELGQALLRMNVLSSNLLNDLGNLYFLKKDYKESLRIYKKAYELDNNNIFVIKNILKALKAEKRTDEYNSYKLKLEKIAPFLRNF